MFSRLRTMNLNTALVPVYWDLCEPEEDRFDFSLVAAAIEAARANDLRLVLLWFGAWKNSMSCYAPGWVKRDSERFQRVRTRAGVAQEILSPGCPETLKSDQRAYLELLTWLAEVDQEHQTVLMMQIENEIGMIPEPRDYSPLSEALWLSGQWESEEAFSAWQFATYVEKLSATGKEIYPLPTFVNAALIRPGYQPGQYPSGGPLPHLLNIWKDNAPSIDFLAPDIYFPNFVDWAEKYRVGGNTMFVPEMAPSSRMSANALHAIAALDSIGTCPFSIESLSEDKSADLGQLYGLLAQVGQLWEEPRIGLTPRLDFDWNLASQSESGTLAETCFTAKFDRAEREGSEAITALPTHGNGRWEAPSGTPLGGVMIIQLDEKEFVALGKGTVVTFGPASGQERVGIESCQEGTYANGAWQGRRWLNGDQTHQGRHIHLPADRWSMQRFKLYRYE